MYKLNNEQYRAVVHCNGPMLVLAGPGSGKTATIISRIINLISEYKVPADNILVLTFSKQAAYEMQQRFINHSKEQIYPVTFGTFHSIFYHILIKQGLYCNHEILSNKRKSDIIKHIIRKKNKDFILNEGTISKLISLISLKKQNISIEFNEDGIDFDEVYSDYVSACKNDNLLDFEDMIISCMKLFMNEKNVLYKWQNRFKYILIDEFQDIDYNQYEIIKMLAGNSKNLFCVGDDDQSIYSFRGASPDVMKSFLDDYNEVKVVNLIKNYRCAEDIIESAQKIIKNNKNRLVKRQIGVRDYGNDNIIYCCFKSQYDEAKYCVNVINEVLIKGEENLCVLYRASRNADVIENALKLNRINYVRKDMADSNIRKEWVKDILAYIKTSVSHGIDDYLRILNKPYRALSRECLSSSYNYKELYKYYEYGEDDYYNLKRLCEDIDFISNLNSYAAINYILYGIGLKKYIKNRYFSHNIESFEEDIDSLINVSRIYSTKEEFIDYLENKGIKGNNSKNSRVKLMTIHGSKGLEFDNVIMIGLQEGIFPSKMCDTEASLEEERRLFYVAMTRARKKLWLLGRRIDDYGKRESRFLSEAGFSYLR